MLRSRKLVQYGQTSQQGIEALLRSPAEIGELTSRERVISIDEAIPEILREENARKLFLLKSDSGPLAFLIRDHGTAYSRWEISRLLGITGDGVVLIHCDFHQDLVAPNIVPRPNTIREAIDQSSKYGNLHFIVPAIYHGLIDEVFHVKPRLSPREHERNMWRLGIGPVESGKQELYFVQGSEIESLLESGFLPADVTWTKRIPVHTIPPNQLSRLKNDPRQKIFDFENDYVHSGKVDTRYFGLNENGIIRKMRGVAEELKRGIQDSGLQFHVATITLSPDFTPSRHIPQITKDISHVLSSPEPRVLIIG